MLFNIFINELFLFVSNSYLSNYTGDNISYAFGYNLEETKNTLRFDFDLVSKWFEENYMVLNADKCHFMCLGKGREINVTLCGIQALSRLLNHLSDSQKRLIFNSLIKSQFNYCNGCFVLEHQII